VGVWSRLDLGVTIEESRAVLVHRPNAEVVYTADRGGYNLSTYALAILVHIYNSLINMGCLHILPHI
jgi:hypothetical protein